MNNNQIGKFIFRNKNLVIIILLSLLPSIPFFVTSDLLHTHDGLVHLPRLAAYFHALSDGHFPVRFAGYLNYGYGLPLFNFIYQTPYLIGSSLLLLGFSLVTAFKLTLTFSFVLAGIFMYLFGSLYFADTRKGLLMAVFYQFVPFRMVEYLVRGSFGEVYTYAFFPLVLYGLVLIQKKFIFKGYLITSIALALLIISHNSVSLLFAGASLLFLLFTAQKLKDMIISFIAFFTGVLLSSFYWIPAIVEHKYTYGNLFMENLYKEHFVPFQNYFIPNLTNDPKFQIGGITIFIGLFQVIALLLSLILIAKKIDHKTKRLFIIAYLLMLIAFFFMSQLSSFIWEMPISQLLRQFQFPWRFLALIVVATSFLSISFLSYSKFFKKNLYYYGLIICVVISVSLFWKASLGYDKINEKYYWNFPLNTTYYGETDVIWSAGPAKSYPKSRVEIIEGKGEIKEFLKKNHFQRFVTKSENGMTLVLNTQFYPGWKVYVNDKEVPIQFQDPNHRGLIIFTTPAGENRVEVKFEENKLRFASDLLSLFGLILIVPAAFLIKKYFR